MIHSRFLTVDFVAGFFGNVRCNSAKVAALAIVALSVTPASAALTHRWAFDEPNGTAPPQVLDSVGGDHGTFVNMNDTNRSFDKAPASFAGRSLVFDGINETVTLTSQIALPENTNYSVAFWYRGTEAGETDDLGRGLIGRDANDVYSNIILDRGGRVEYLRFSGGWQHNVTSTSLVNNDAWHHIAFVNHSTATADLYIDGVQEVFGQSSTSSLVYPFRIDGFMIEFPGRFSDGKLDEVRIYDHALTAAEALALSQAAVPEPSTLALLGLGVVGIAIKARRRRTMA